MTTETTPPVANRAADGSASKKARRTQAEQKLALQEKIKLLDQKAEVLDKRLLLKLADQISTLAKRRPQQPTIGQAATLLSQAAAAIKADIPQ